MTLPPEQPPNEDSSRHLPAQPPTHPAVPTPPYPQQDQQPTDPPAYPLQYQHQYPQQYRQPYSQLHQQPGYPQQHQGYYPTQVKAKSPGLALAASFFFPGLGSLINGSVGIGIAIFVSWVFSWFLLALVIGFITLPAVWIWGMYDGYHGAQQWNRAHGIVS